jgi:hypothetical protein
VALDAGYRVICTGMNVVLEPLVPLHGSKVPVQVIRQRSLVSRSFVLKLITLPVKNDSNDIFAMLSEVFLSALTLGDFFQETTNKNEVNSYVASGGQPWVFRLLFGVFNFFFRQIS